MKKIILSLILLSGCAIASAQVNLREGIVITLGGDTLHGMIDYRTKTMNAEQCLFVEDGKPEPQTFQPGQIAGYRFTDNGKYYVSKDVELGGGEHKTVFLEYILKGEISLYYLGNNAEFDIFYIEDQNGELAMLKEMPVDATKIDRRNNIEAAYKMMAKSPRATNMLWTKELDLRNVRRITQTYLDDACPDGKCEVFEYKAKETPKAERTVHWTLFAGYAMCGIKTKGSDDDATDFYPGVCIGGGVDIYVPRLCKGLLAQISLDYCHASGSKTHYTTQSELDMATGSLVNKKVAHKTDVECTDLSLKGGAAYQFQQWKVQPRASIGILADFPDGPLKKFYVGEYAGLGVVSPLHRGALLADARFSRFNVSGTDVKYLTFTLGYQF